MKTHVHVIPMKNPNEKSTFNDWFKQPRPRLYPLYPSFSENFSSKWMSNADCGGGGGIRVGMVTIEIN